MKINKLLVLALTLVLMTSTFSFAEETLNINNREKLNILQVVEKYSPEKLEEWKRVVNERRELIKELRESKGKIIDSKRFLEKNKEFTGDLKAEAEDKRIKEKGRWRRKEKCNRCGINNLKKDLCKALSDGDAEKVKVILDKLLVEYKEINRGLSERVK